jgi:hypothetical protein
MTGSGVERERRLALLLADGSGNFDFVRAVGIEDVAYLEGHVTSVEHKRRAADLARYVGFTRVENLLRVMPGGESVLPAEGTAR